MNTIRWMPTRHFNLFRVWQGTANIEVSVRTWMNGDFTSHFLKDAKELNPFFHLRIIIHWLNFEFLYWWGKIININQN